MGSVSKTRFANSDSKRSTLSTSPAAPLSPTPPQVRGIRGGCPEPALSGAEGSRAFRDLGVGCVTAGKVITCARAAVYLRAYCRTCSNSQASNTPRPEHQLYDQPADMQTWATRHGEMQTRPTRPTLRREVAGDVQDQLRQVRGEGIDGAVVGRHDRHVRRDESIHRVQRRDCRLLLPSGHSVR